MKTSTFVYPWDVIGDPGAAARIADLGVQQVTLAAAYHSTRALTPRHPRHRVVTAEHAAVLYPPDPARWADHDVRPYAAGDWASGDAYGEAAEALTAAGLDVHSWVVLAHSSRLGAERPDTSVVNAYGDRYPWAPCIARPAVAAYLTELAAEAAVRPGTGTRGVELESCGWYGFEHLHAHDKTAGVALGDAARYLLSLCFCTDCRAGYGGLGADPDELAAAVRGALAPGWAAGAGGAGESGLQGIEGLLGADLAAVTLDWRGGVARTLQEAAVRAVRAEAVRAGAAARAGAGVDAVAGGSGRGFQVLLHADPAPYRTGANSGVDPAHILGVADGVVLPCTGGAAGAMLGPFADHRSGSTVLAANFNIVRGMGGDPAGLAEDAVRARALGATELRLYHAGLASDADLADVRDALAKSAG
ncbi:hypothetical protein [Streptomyces paludis]|uniref:Alanine-rich protein n=1 Tax=Streptomyces paludis TaxID=2282738 RepID=A0A345HKJ7_9ACTN|nr:hypothetical protein [Streptomyces paludis]AXG77221.1 hypothetical protein DVK44_05450 [Streptomyces paludis]